MPRQLAVGLETIEELRQTRLVLHDVNHLARRFADADKDGNRALDFSEWARGVLPKPMCAQFTESTLRAWFQSADLDGDGRLSVEEYFIFALSFACDKVGVDAVVRHDAVLRASYHRERNYSNTGYVAGYHGYNHVWGCFGASLQAWVRFGESARRHAPTPLITAASYTRSRGGAPTTRRRSACSSTATAAPGRPRTRARRATRQASQGRRRCGCAEVAQERVSRSV